jgi:hypothetical protein
MRWLGLVMLALCFDASLAGAQEKSRAFTFTQADVGKTPAGWNAEKTGMGEGSIWQVVADETAPSRSGYVLAQTAEGPKSLFNLCVAANTRCRNVEAMVAFKANQGKLDQGGGIVWRYLDANNYYLARMNPLEDNFRVYKVVAGKRSKECQDASVKVPAGTWHTLKIKMVGDHIECFLDGQKLLDVHDDSITAAGQVGLWTKADAQTSFDGFRVRELKD